MPQIARKVTRPPDWQAPGRPEGHRSRTREGRAPETGCRANKRPEEEA